MDEIDYKLRSNNSVLVVNAIEKLITTIKSKFKLAERQRFILENEELKFLREKCSSKDPVVSLTACQGLLALVEGGVLEIGHTMSTIITLLPTAHNFSAIISTIAGLLILDLQCRLVPGQEYKCRFSLKSPQHPFITVLEKNSEATEDVITQMHALCTHPDYIVSSNSAEMLLPVFLYLSCRPHAQVSTDSRVWQLLLTVNHSRPDLLLDCLTWQQTTNKQQTSSALAAITAVTETKLYQQQREYVVALMPVLAFLSNEIVRHSGDPRPSYHLLDRCLSAGAGEGALSLSLLADSLPSLCALHLQQIMHTCLSIITRYDYPTISLSIFVAQTLQWLHLPSTLTNNALKVAAKILETYRGRNKHDTNLIMPNLYANKTFQRFLFTNESLSIKYHLFDTWERISNDPTKLRRWFDNIEMVDEVVHLEMASFLIGVFMEKRSDLYEEFSLRALKILVKLVDVKKDLSVRLLPVLLYKIANDVSPIMKLECLKALPLMAKAKENVPTIVTVLNKLKSSKAVPLSTLIMLHSALTESQVRCFPYLQELLVDGATRPHDVKWEIEIAKAMAVKRVCETRASLGLELVPILSSLLNRSSDPLGAVSHCISLRALPPLWAQGLVAPVSTWTALAPNMEREKRAVVVDCFFRALSQFPTNVPSAVWVEVAAAAWRRVGEAWAGGLGAGAGAGAGGAGAGVGGEVSGAAEVLARACIATVVPLRCVPEIFRKTVKLPSSYCKTPEDAARNPEDVLEYIPSEVWPEVFKYSSLEALPSVSALTSRLIDHEVRGYRSGIYRREGGEPANYAYLPVTSVCRGLGEYISKQASHRTYECPDSVLLSILQTLGAPYARPLPPAALWWLQGLLAEGPHWRGPGLLLAARQAEMCGSASKLFESFLQSLDDGWQETDIIIFFEVLPVAAKNLPPNSLRRPLEKCLSDSYEQIVHTKFTDVPPEDIKDKLFVKQLGLIKVCLQNDKIHEANRTLISQVLEGYWTKISQDNVSWPTYLATCACLPPAQLERMTSPLSWWEYDSRVFRASCALRCLLATDSLVWINEIIDAAAMQIAEQEYTLQQMLPALQNAKAGEESRDWLLQLMARTQVAFAEMETEPPKQFLFDVLSVSVITLSGHWSLAGYLPASRLPADRELRASLFPAAVASLFGREKWLEFAPRVLECIIKFSLTDAAYSEVCRLAAAALRRHAGAALWTLAMRTTAG